MAADLAVLLIAPTQRDARYSQTILKEAKIRCVICLTLEELISNLGDTTGAILVSEETLPLEHTARLAEALRQQPAWSDPPVVLLTRSGAESLSARRALERLSNLTLLERPVRVATLLSVLRTALKARERQLQTRDHLLAMAQMNEQLEQLAFYDTLTALPNRVLLQDRLTQAMAHARREKRPCAVLFLDFDNFKVINDSLGHSFGDRVLQTIGNRLKDVLRSEDTAARLGGDEFVVILHEMQEATDAAAVAQKILQCVAAPFYIDDHEVRMTTSLGIAVYNGEDDSPDDLLKHADLAMYHAKEQGKQAFRFFTPRLHRRAMERLSLEGELRRALDNQEIILHYQPRVVLPDAEITGFEALARWHHPRKGLIAPDQFIPLAEETGLIWELGKLVLQRACWQSRRWQEAGYPPLRMAVNLSARQLRHAGLVELVAQVLGETKLPPYLLELEITETAAMARIDDTLTKLQALKALGVCLSIDDFGTGYSSLSYLQRLPIDGIKIDRGFISTTDNITDPNKVITRTIIALGKNLGIKLIGEGVETPAQRDNLSELGCDEAQGFLFGQPLAAHDITKLLDQQGAKQPGKC